MDTTNDYNDDIDTLRELDTLDYMTLNMCLNRDIAIVIKRDNLDYMEVKNLLNLLKEYIK